MGFIGDMQKARQMQQLMKEERATASAGNVTVRVNGSFEVEDISADGDVSTQTLSDVRDAINKAFREVQKGLAAKLSRLA
ncbi:MAG: YbaB/EbfC family nucleoid-associated protein [Patescibacteria group bacterium]